MDKTISFIVGGGITRSLLEGLARARKMPENIVVADTGAEALRRM